MDKAVEYIDGSGTSVRACAVVALVTSWYCMIRLITWMFLVNLMLMHLHTNL